MRYVIKTLEILAAAASNQSSQSRWLDAAAALQPNQIKINNAISKYPARWRVDAVRISCSYLKSGSSFFRKLPGDFLWTVGVSSGAIA